MVHCKQPRWRPDGVPEPWVAARAVPGYMRPTSSSVAREMPPTEREPVFGTSTRRAARTRTRTTSSSTHKSARACSCSCSFKGLQLQGSPSPPQLHRSSTTTAPPDLPLPLPLPAAPANMADATPLLPGLPNDIAIWEILIRLPPKPLLRCRAVSPAWHRATSSRDFLLSHHARQPALPLLCSYGDDDGVPVSLGIVPFDHRAAAAADRFQPVARLQRPPYEAQPSVTPRIYLEASSDGLLLLSLLTFDLCICNPATRQYAPLHQLKGFHVMEMYPHPPTGEYRLLLYRTDDDATYVFTLGSAQPPRHIGGPDPTYNEQLLFQGSIYWYTGSGIMVFDTVDESFRQIPAPVASVYAQLFETGDMLGIFFYDREKTAVVIWVMQDYQGEVWDFKRRVELPFAETRQQCQCSYHGETVMVVPGDGELLILLKCGDWLFQIDIDGKLIASFQLPRGIDATTYLLKQTLVQHTFFPTLEGYVVNAAPPFI